MEIEVKTNKDLYLVQTVGGLSEISKIPSSAIIPEGTTFSVIDILIDRSNQNLGASGIAFLCENEELGIFDFINAEDIEEQF